MKGTIRGNRMIPVEGHSVKPVMIQCQAFKQGSMKPCEKRKAEILSVLDVEGYFGYAGRQTTYLCLGCKETFVLRH
jgi:hypothetical protein